MALNRRESLFWEALSLIVVELCQLDALAISEAACERTILIYPSRGTLFVRAKFLD